MTCSLDDCGLLQLQHSHTGHPLWLPRACDQQCALSTTHLSDINRVAPLQASTITQHASHSFCLGIWLRVAGPAQYPVHQGLSLRKDPVALSGGDLSNNILRANLYDIGGHMHRQSGRCHVHVYMPQKKTQTFVPCGLEAVQKKQTLQV